MTIRVVPDLVNQFRRLIETSPNHYAYGTAWNDIINGQDFDNRNCMAAMGAVAASCQTGLTRHFSPKDIRNNQHDFKGGIGHDDVQDAFAKLGLPAFLLPGGGDDWAQSMKWVRDGRFVWWAAQYGKVPFDVQAQKGGNFDHALGAFQMFEDGTFLLFDPLAKALQRVAQHDIRPSVEAIALRLRGDADKLFVGATKVLPAAGLQLRYGGVKTKPYPDRTRADGHNGDPVNVHSKPTTGLASVVGQLPDGDLFTSYQKTATGASFEGSRTWYGDKAGRRWIAAKRLSHKGGST